MNRRIFRKRRKKLYIKYIDDVSIEISLDHEWRRKLFFSNYGTRYEISNNSKVNLPTYIEEPIKKYDLVFIVEKVVECKIHFDEGLVPFKFQSGEFRNIVRYSGNNPIII